MAQKTREKEFSSGEEYIEVKAWGQNTRVVVKVKRGSTLQEILDAVIEELAKDGVEVTDLAKWMLLVDGERVEIDEETGKIREDQNEVVTEDIILTLTKDVTGGRKRCI